MSGKVSGAGGSLARRLGVRDAVVIGLGSMIGAGIYSALAPAAAAAGAGLLIGLALAAIIAYLNATASAQLAAQYPTSGGTYVYGRERLGAWPGFLAGWSFVIGKTASCAAMAMTFAAYVAPGAWQKPVAAAAVVALAAVNCFGVTRTAGLARVIVSVVLGVLAVVVASGIGAGLGGAGAGLGGAGAAIGASGWYGVLQSAGLLFFAFAGYARIATMGEEVKDPARAIPRAILMALGITLSVYAAVAATVLGVLGPTSLAGSSAPLVDTVIVAGWSWAVPLVRVGAAAASLGALLALIAGVGRTALAMARNDDAPRWLAAVHPRHRVPHHAEVGLALVVSALVLIVDLRGAIGFSSFGVLLYYSIANAAAYTQDAARRRWPRWMQVAGVLGCLLLVASLPPTSIATGLAVLAVGVAYRIARVTRRS